MNRISLIVFILFFLSSSAIARNVCNCKGYDGPGGPCYAEPGGPAYTGPGGPAYAGEGGPCYAGEGGKCYSGPGGGWSCPSVCSKCDSLLQDKFGE
tara:strand:+ start:348 stop:635 length:288 start_codon:yes stop_codon:yes gene_type:complete